MVVWMILETFPYIFQAEQTTSNYRKCWNYDSRRRCTEIPQHCGDTSPVLYQPVYYIHSPLEGDSVWALTERKFTKKGWKNT